MSQRHHSSHHSSSSRHVSSHHRSPRHGSSRQGFSHHGSSSLSLPRRGSGETINLGLEDTVQPDGPLERGQYSVRTTYYPTNPYQGNLSGDAQYAVPPNMQNSSWPASDSLPLTQQNLDHLTHNTVSPNERYSDRNTPRAASRNAERYQPSEGRVNEPPT